VFLAILHSPLRGDITPQMVFSLIITIQSSFLGIRRVLGPKSGKKSKISILTLFDPKTAKFRAGNG